MRSYPSFGRYRLPHQRFYSSSSFSCSSFSSFFSLLLLLLAESPDPRPIHPWEFPARAEMTLGLERLSLLLVFRSNLPDFELAASFNSPNFLVPCPARSTWSLLQMIHWLLCSSLSVPFSPQSQLSNFLSLRVMIECLLIPQFMFLSLAIV